MTETAPSERARRITQDETTRSLALWFGILAGPLAWTVQTLVAPDLHEVLCYPGAGASAGAVYGVPIETVIVVLSAALLGATVLAGLVSYRCWRRGKSAAANERATWMARAGVLVSVLFGLAIAIGFLPVVLLDACEVPL